MHSLQLNVDLDDRTAVEVVAPAVRTLPFVYASPHSGRLYPAEFVGEARLDPVSLRRSEDFMVDELFAGAPGLGAPLVKALFPRSYCDPNREPYELDPAMFEDELPPFANTTSQRVVGGLGTIARVVGAGQEIYRRKLTFAEAERRIATCYRPYHRTVAEQVERTAELFGFAVLIDCHSMPSVGGPRDHDQGLARPDVVLGDRFGGSCATIVTDAAERAFRALGYRIVRNAPYAGGFVTQHYGRPRAGRHALQIEINRALYMDEARLEPRADFDSVASDMARFVAAMAEVADAIALRAA